MPRTSYGEVSVLKVTRDQTGRLHGTRKMIQSLVYDGHGQALVTGIDESSILQYHANKALTWGVKDGQSTLVRDHWRRLDSCHFNAFTGESRKFHFHVTGELVEDIPWCGMAFAINLILLMTRKVLGGQCPSYWQHRFQRQCTPS